MAEFSDETRSPAHNSRFAKAGASCFYESEVLNSSFVLLMNFCAKYPPHRQAANRYASFWGDLQTLTELNKQTDKLMI